MLHHFGPAVFLVIVFLEKSCRMKYMLVPFSQTFIDEYLLLSSNGCNQGRNQGGAKGAEALPLSQSHS